MSIELLSISTVGVIGIIAAIIVVFIGLVSFLTRYKKCPADKIMVIYGKVGYNKDGTVCSSKCIHGGAAFIVPLFQSYAFLDLSPIAVELDLKRLLTRGSNRIDVLSRFTVAISTEQGIMQVAAERLLGLQPYDIQELAKEIITGQMRIVAALTDIEEIEADYDKFLEAVSFVTDGELKKVGLRLININISDIKEVIK